MNTTDITGERDAPFSNRDFWKVAAPVSGFIALVAISVATRRRLASLWCWMKNLGGTTKKAG